MRTSFTLHVNRTHFASSVIVYRKWKKLKREDQRKKALQLRVNMASSLTAPPVYYASSHSGLPPLPDYNETDAPRYLVIKNDLRDNMRCAFF